MHMPFYEESTRHHGAAVGSGEQDRLTLPAAHRSPCVIRCGSAQSMVIWNLVVMEHL